MTQEKAALVIRQIADAIVQTAKEAGPMGIPGGHVYAALMTYGLRLDQYEQIMAALVQAGKLRREGECYHATA